MVEASPYIIVTVALPLIVLIVGFLWICRAAMRSGTAFEGEIKNRLLSMKISTVPPPESDASRGERDSSASPDREAA